MKVVIAGAGFGGLKLARQLNNKAGFEVRKKMYEDIYLYYKLNFGWKVYLLIPVLMFRLLLISIFR